MYTSTCLIASSLAILYEHQYKNPGISDVPIFCDSPCMNGWQRTLHVSSIAILWRQLFHSSLLRMKGDPRAVERVHNPEGETKPPNSPRHNSGTNVLSLQDCYPTGAERKVTGDWGGQRGKMVSGLGLRGFEIIEMELGQRVRQWWAW